MDIISTKNALITFTGTVGGIITSAIGGWDSSLTTLVTFMAVDYVTGIIVAGVFHNSNKTDAGTLESRAGFKGLCKKAVMLLCVLMGYRLDVTMGTNIVKDGVTIAFIANEALSIIENAGLMGVPMPEAIKNAVSALKNTEK
jgi:toxin secretion/phage lysis holin